MSAYVVSLVAHGRGSGVAEGPVFNICGPGDLPVMHSADRPERAEQPQVARDVDSATNGGFSSSA